MNTRKRSPLPAEVSRKNASMMAREKDRRHVVHAQIALQAKGNNFVESTQWSSDITHSMNTSAQKAKRMNIFNNQRPST